MKVKDNKKVYQRYYDKHWNDSELSVHYIATNGSETRKFKSMQKLADFLGYSKKSMWSMLKRKNKILLGWKIERYKWYEHLNEINNTVTN